MTTDTCQRHLGAFCAYARRRDVDILLPKAGPGDLVSEAVAWAGPTVKEEQ